MVICYTHCRTSNYTDLDIITSVMLSFKMCDFGRNTYTLNLISVKFVICSKISPNLMEFRIHIP